LRTHRAIMAATVVVGVVLVAGVVNLSLRKHVTLVVDGEHVTVSTMSDSVQDLLDDEGITLSSAVLVQPSPTSVIADGMTVVVNPARVVGRRGVPRCERRRRRGRRPRGLRKPHRCGGLGDGRDERGLRRTGGPARRE